MMRIVIFLFSYIILLNLVYAGLSVELTVGTEEGGGAPSIAIVPFGVSANTPPPQDIASIISSDLHRSGRFSPMSTSSLPEHPTYAHQVTFSNWQAMDIPYLVIGRISGGSLSGYTVEFELFDVYKGTRLIGFQYPATVQTLRQVAHQISDKIYNALLGVRGVFGTRIVYVTLQGRGKQKEYQLQVADADGANPRLMLRSTEPIFSPTWSPDGRRIAYVTYENRGSDKKMAIYVQEVQTGRRMRISDKRGLNAAPAWSPDGTRLAVTLSHEGNPEIYVFNLHTGTLTRLTNSPAIDTEPEWAPDGQSLVFTSDRTGNQPQIYRMAADGSQVQRLTFKGNYNARARFSPDGNRLALLHSGGQGYRIASLDLGSGNLKILSQTSLDESPSFAPNGDMIIYATGSELAAVSSDGSVRQRLVVNLGEEVREPAWSPFPY